jgi:hypothetical protein
MLPNNLISLLVILASAHFLSCLDIFADSHRHGTCISDEIFLYRSSDTECYLVPSGGQKEGAAVQGSQDYAHQLEKGTGEWRGGFTVMALPDNKTAECFIIGLL